MTRTLPTPVHVRPVYAFYGQAPCVATFQESSMDLDGSHCSREKGLLTQSTARRLTDPQDRTQFLSQANQWSSRLKLSFCRQPTTRHTRPINTTCDQYVQYLLTGTNSSVLNRHRRGLPHKNLRIATTISPSFPSECSTDLPTGPTWSQIIHPTITNWTGDGTNPKSRKWEPPLNFYRNLPSKHSITNGKPPQDRGNKDKPEGQS
jgi:hypothetical protein